MKVLLVNGSSRENGCTAAALAEVARALRESGVDTETFFIGNKPLPDCIACRKCAQTGKCVFDDTANELAAKAAVMDRAFYSGGRNFAFKPAAAVLSARRAGSVASFDVINKYFTICSMPVVSSTYWNHVFGSQPEDVAQDKEGLMTMYNLGKNMAWLLECIRVAKENGVAVPVNEKIRTNFVR